MGVLVPIEMLNKLLISYPLGGVSFVIAAWVLVMALPAKYFMSWIADDAFYYYQVARNIVTGNGPSFDGFSPTNGWHPLYMLTSIAVQALAGPGTDLAVRAQFFVNAIIYAMAGVILAKLLCKVIGHIAGVILLILWFSDGRLVAAALSGLEMPLVLITFSMFFYFIIIEFKSDVIKHWFFVSLLTTLAILSRLDIGLVVLPIVVWFAIIAVIDPQANLKQKRARLAALLIPFFTIFAAYMAFNMRIFGLALPISGIVKRIWAVAWFNGIKDPYWHYGLYQFKMHFVEIVLPVAMLRSVQTFSQLILYMSMALGIAFMIWSRRLSWSVTNLKFDQSRVVLVIMALLGITMHMLYYSFFQLDTREWYWGPEYVLIYLGWSMGIGAISMASNRGLQLFRRGRVAVIGLWLTIALSTVAWIAPFLTLSQMAESAKVSYNAWDGFYYEAAMWMRNVLPQGAKAGAWDAGYIGYFSGLHVINLDGMANSADFLPYINYTHNLTADRDHQIGQYIRDKQIRYVVLNRTVGQEDPYALKESICSIEDSCTIVYLEYRTNYPGNTRRWLAIIELTHIESGLEEESGLFFA